MKRASQFALAVVFLLGLTYSLTPCACVTLAEISVDVLTDENRRVLEAQQAFYTRHGRYAQTVTELQHAPNAAIDLQIKTESDSSIVLRSTFRMMPEKTCSLAVRPDIGSLDGLICSHK